MLSKQFAMEVILLVALAIAAVLVGCSFSIEHLQLYAIAVQKEVLEFGFDYSLLLYGGMVWLLFPVLELCLMHCLRSLSPNEWFFAVVSFIGWFNIIQLSHHGFGVLMFTAEFVFGLALISYFKMVRMKHLVRLVELVTRRDRSQTGPIPLH